MKKVGEKLYLAYDIIIALDIIISLLIILAAFSLSQTQLGKAALTFGIVMVGVVTTLAVLNKIN
jgi:hypothetical protein